MEAEPVVQALGLLVAILQLLLLQCLLLLMMALMTMMLLMVVLKMRAKVGLDRGMMVL